MPTSTSSPILQDFDQPDLFSKYRAAFLSADSLNFVLEFDHEKAHAAFNLQHDDFRSVVHSERIAAGCTWINIWAPERQKKNLELLAVHYGFSPRLLGTMCAQPMEPALSTSQTYLSELEDLAHERTVGEPKAAQSHVLGIEEDLEMQASRKVPAQALDLNHYRIVSEVWHYFSIDWGNKYLCIGYNSLYNTEMSTVNVAGAGQPNQYLPAGTRVWTWLVLCDDGTVISIHENPFPHRKSPLNTIEQHSLNIIRRNSLNVFDNCSKTNDAYFSQNPSIALPIRTGIHPTLPGSIHSSSVAISDSPSLLFHYLFDDWFTSYSLVSKKEHQYGNRLETLRKEMFERATLGHLEKLHRMGRQLAMLKRMYQSYDLIIGRILERQRGNTNANARSTPLSRSVTNVQTFVSSQTIEAPAGFTSDATSLGVPLSAAASARFERLKDRINLYALSEIQDCLNEKETLTNLNFNLITLKESQYVERLTRFTITLTKGTLFFLPVSLLTSYFALPIASKYTVVTYWTAFTIMFAITFSFLVIFGRMTGTWEGKPIYRSIASLFVDASRRKIKSKGGGRWRD